MIVAIDTSALAKLIVEERESPSLRARLSMGAERDQFIISSMALVELRRLAIRGALAVDVEDLISRFRVIRLSEAVLQIAGRLKERRLGTLDAIHIASALATEARGFVTYDRTQASAAEHEGLIVQSPEAADEG